MSAFNPSNGTETMPNETDNDNGEKITAKNVQFLEAGAVNRDPSGEPAFFMQVAARGEVEPVMFMTLWDARRLTRHLLSTLEFFGDPWAERLASYFEEEKVSDPGWRGEGDPTAAPWPARQVLTTAKLNAVADGRNRIRTGRTPSKVRVTFHPDPRNRRRTLSAAVFGGYRNGDTLVLLCRVRRKTGTVDMLLRADKGNGNSYLGVPEEGMAPHEKITAEGWDRFLGTADGAMVKIDGRYWQKVSLSELAVLAGKTLFASRW